MPFDTALPSPSMPYSVRSKVYCDIYADGPMRDLQE